MVIVFTIVTCTILRYKTPIVTDIYKIRDEMKLIVRLGIFGVTWYLSAQTIGQYFGLLENSPTFRYFTVTVWILCLTTG